MAWPYLHAFRWPLFFLIQDPLSNVSSCTDVCGKHARQYVTTIKLITKTMLTNNTARSLRLTNKGNTSTQWLLWSVIVTKHTFLYFFSRSCILSSVSPSTSVLHWPANSLLSHNKRWTIRLYSVTITSHTIFISLMPATYSGLHRLVAGSMFQCIRNSRGRRVIAQKHITRNHLMKIKWSLENLMINNTSNFLYILI